MTLSLLLGLTLPLAAQTNSAPTDITLTSSSIAENNVANATVGILSATDADAGDLLRSGALFGESADRMKTTLGVDPAVWYTSVTTTQRSGLVVSPAIKWMKAS